MASPGLVPVLWAVFLVTLISFAEVTGDESVNDAAELDEDMEKRGGSFACRRCLHNSEDWGSCLTCFSRPGPAPYYGNKRSVKRASDPYDWDEKRASANPYDWDAKRAYNPYDWRSFSAADMDKRAYNPYDWKSFAAEDLDKRAFNPYEWSSDMDKRANNPYDMEVKKRGLSSCRCCMKTRLTSCCNKCEYAHYFTKRAFRTSYRPQYDENCTCCRKDRFNYACCMNCSGKRK